MEPVQSQRNALRFSQHSPFFKNTSKLQYNIWIGTEFGYDICREKFRECSKKVARIRQMPFVCHGSKLHEVNLFLPHHHGGIGQKFGYACMEI